jgi:hypothetical protein
LEPVDHSQDQVSPAIANRVGWPAAFEVRMWTEDPQAGFVWRVELGKLIEYPLQSQQLV